MSFDALLLKLERRDPGLSPAERDILERAVCDIEVFGPGCDIVRQGDQARGCSLLLSGWACRYGMLEDGRRQIYALHVAGDFVDLHGFLLRRLDHSVGALSRCQTAVVPHERLLEITEQHPHLTRLLWLSTVIDAAILRQWILGLGCRSALQRAAHLMCELQARLEVVGLSSGESFDLPIRQATFAEALGVTVIHANRVLRELRAQRLLTWTRPRVEIHDLAALRRLAEFDPTYLNLEPLPR